MGTRAPLARALKRFSYGTVIVVSPTGPEAEVHQSCEGTGVAAVHGRQTHVTQGRASMWQQQLRAHGSALCSAWPRHSAGLPPSSKLQLCPLGLVECLTAVPARTASSDHAPADEAAVRGPADAVERLERLAGVRARGWLLVVRLCCLLVDMATPGHTFAP